jgi:DHA3 family macrolide efflux protein-like MFS transporter
LKMEEIADKKTFRNYMMFWSGQLFSLFGSSVAFFVIIWWITIETGSAVLLALASFLYILPMTLIMPIAGVLADKHNRKIIIGVVDSLQALSTFILIILFHLNIVNAANTWIVLIFISIRSTFQAFHLPTVNAIIPAMVPKDKLSRINGINFLFTGVVQILAPFVAASLMVFLTINQMLWIDVFTFYIALIPLVFIAIPSFNRVSNEQESIEKSSFFKEFRLGIKTLKLIPGLVIMIVLSALLNFLIRPLDTLLSLFVVENHGGTELLYALTLIIFQGGMISGALLTTIKKNWNNKIRVIFICIAIALVGYMILALAPKGLLLIVGGIGGFILGFNLPIINALYQTFVQTTVPADKIGRVTSIDHTLSMAISPLGTLLSGPIAVFIGIPLLFFSCGFIGLIYTLAIWGFTGIRKVDIDSESALEKINGQIENLTI